MILKSIKSSCGYKCFSAPLEFEFYPEKIICIIGENGSGKTTILNYISSFDTEHYPNAWAAIKKYNFDNYIFDNKVHNLNCNPIFSKIFELIGINNSFFENNQQYYLKNNINLRFDELSSGEQQLIKTFSFIYYVISDKECNWSAQKIILLDEPDAHLNGKLRREFVYLLKESIKNFNNIQIIFTTHNTEVISDLNEEQVYLCKNNTLKNINFNPYGEKKDILDKKLFGHEYNISRSVEEDINIYRSKIKKLKYQKNCFGNSNIQDELKDLENDIEYKISNNRHKIELLKKIEEMKR